MQEANKPSLQTHSKTETVLSHFEKLHQGSLAAACSENDHSSDPCQGFLPDCTPAPTLKMALYGIEMSPLWLAPHRKERECCQALASCSSHALAEQYNVEGSDFTPAPWWTPWVPLEQVDNHVDCSK